MATKQEDFFNAVTDGVMTWLEHYHVEASETPRSDWIIYALMSLAGGILAQAPKDVKPQVLVEALAHFGQMSGANVDAFELIEPPSQLH